MKRATIYAGKSIVAAIVGWTIAKTLAVLGIGLVEFWMYASGY